MPSGVGINMTTAIKPITIANAQFPAVIRIKIMANTTSATITSIIE